MVDNLGAHHADTSIPPQLVTAPEALQLCLHLAGVRGGCYRMFLHSLRRGSSAHTDLKVALTRTEALNFQLREPHPRCAESSLVLCPAEWLQLIQVQVVDGEEKLSFHSPCPEFELQLKP